MFSTPARDISTWFLTSISPEEDASPCFRWHRREANSCSTRRRKVFGSRKKLPVKGKVQETDLDLNSAYLSLKQIRLELRGVGKDPFSSFRIPCQLIFNLSNKLGDQLVQKRFRFLLEDLSEENLFLLLWSCLLTASFKSLRATESTKYRSLSFCHFDIWSILFVSFHCETSPFPSLWPTSNHLLNWWTRTRQHQYQSLWLSIFLRNPQQHQMASQESQRYLGHHLIHKGKQNKTGLYQVRPTFEAAVAGVGKYIV